MTAKCILPATLMMLLGWPQARAEILCTDLLVESSRYDYEVQEVASASDALERAWSFLFERGYSNETFLFRTTSAKRLDHLLRYGTDRDDTSETYNIPIADSSIQLKSQNGITPKLVSFLHMVTVERPMRTVTLGFPSVDFESKVKEFDRISGDCFAIAIYDSSGLTRVSEVEYWFHKDPRQSLLAVYFKKCG